MVITFAGALRQALLRVFERRTLPLCRQHSLLLLRDTKHRRDALDSYGLVLFTPALQFVSSLIDGCQKY